MKKRMILTMVLFALSATEASAQNFLQKVGKTVEKEVKKEAEKEAERQAKKAVDKAFDNLTSPKDEAKSQPAQTQKTQAQKPATTTTASQTNGEKKYVKNVDLFYKTKRLEGNYKLYYDGSHYYIDKNGKELKLNPCDGEFMEVKYNFYCVEYGVELYVKDALPGAVGKRVVKNDHDI